jgi:hypothetical protein
MSKATVPRTLRPRMARLIGLKAGQDFQQAL